MSPTVAVVGTGVIGASWTTHVLARGYDVRAHDPAPGAEDRLRAAVGARWDAATRLAPGSERGTLVVVDDLAATVRSAGHVQENLPEDLELKRRVLREIDEVADPAVIIASSSSALLPTELQADCRRHPERVIVAHPFDPPHIVPLVELVGGPATTAAEIRRATAFFESAGKRPVHVRGELRGHVANRLQAALWREAYSLVSSGYVSVEDVDTAVSAGPGLRWAQYGPFVNLHLSGGEGGMTRVHEHLGPTMEALWADQRTPTMDPELVEQVEQEVRALTADVGDEAVRLRREELLVQLLAIQSEI